MPAPEFDFSHYYTYDELAQFLHTLAEIYPDLIHLESMGQSYEGREIWLAILTQHQSGLASEKPGYWIDGNIHAGEVTGSAVALYTIRYLLTHYSQEPQITRLLDRYTIYVLPRIAKVMDLFPGNLSMLKGRGQELFDRSWSLLRSLKTYKIICESALLRSILACESS